MSQLRGQAQRWGEARPDLHPQSGFPTWLHYPRLWLHKTRCPPRPPSLESAAALAYERR